MNDTDRNFPAVRAGVGWCLLRAVQRSDPDQHTRVIERLSAECRSRYDTVAGLRWVPLEHHMELSDTIRAEVGEGPSNVAIWERAFRDLFQHRLMSGFVHLAQRMPGSTGYRLARSAPKLYLHMYRNVSDASLEDHDGFCLFRLDGFPAERHTFPCFIEGVLGAMQATKSFDRGGDLTIDMHSTDPCGDLKVLIRKG